MQESEPLRSSAEWTSTSHNRTGKITDRHFFSGIEGARGIAALMVLLYHVGVYSGQVCSTLWHQEGNGIVGAVLAKNEAGLPVFFVLSGALLYRPFALATISESPHPAVGPYLWRRVLRILPAYWLLTAFSLTLLNSMNGPWEVIRPVLLLHIYQPDALPAGMGQTWSLAVEAAFYALLPLAAVGLTKYARCSADPELRARRILSWLALTIVLSFGYTVVSHLPTLGDYPMIYLWLPEYLAYFAVGMAAATLSVCAQLSLRVLRPYDWLVAHPALSWLLAWTAFAVACSPLGDPQTIDYPTISQALLVKLWFLMFSTFLVLPLTALDHPRSLVHLALATPVAQFFGRISYGIFLWHLFFLDGYYAWTGDTHGTADFWMLLAFVFPTAVVCAVVSFYLIEHPAMRLRPRLGRAPVGLSSPTEATITGRGFSGRP